MKRQVWPSLVLVLCLAVGCARKPDDGKISSEVQSKFSQDSGLSTKQLSVQSENGSLVWVAPLDFQGAIQWLVRGTSPGVIVVSAENPDALLETFMVNHLPGSGTPANTQSQQTAAGAESLF